MKQNNPVLISSDEIRRAFSVIATSKTPIPFIAFHDYMIATPEIPESAKVLAADMKSVMDGTHPMFDKNYVKTQLEKIMKECDELGVVYQNRPMHEVLVELNAKRKQARANPEAG